MEYRLGARHRRALGLGTWFVVGLATLTTGITDCNRPPANTNLAALELDAGTGDLIVGFVPDIRAYAVVVPEGTVSVTVRAVPADPAAAVSLSYEGIAYPLGLGGGEADIPLSSGTTSIIPFVSAPGGATQSYRIEVTNGSLDPCAGCDDGNACTADLCDPGDGICTHAALDDFASCDLGNETGACVDGTCGRAYTKAIPVACDDNLGPEPNRLNLELSVATATPVGGLTPQDFTAAFDGVFVFPAWILRALHNASLGGITQVTVPDLAATVQVRSGASGPDVSLGTDASAITPGPVRFCNLPPTQVCTADAECIGGICEAPLLRIDLPTSSDCAPGGVCDLVGEGDSNPSSGCSRHGFCITGDLEVPLASARGTYTPGASGAVLFGWADQNVPGLTVCPAATPECSQPFEPDGAYDLPDATFADPASPFGARLTGEGFGVPFQCAMAEPGGVCAGQTDVGCLRHEDCGSSGPCDYESVAGVSMPTPDPSLVYVGIEEPDAVPCGGGDCNDGDPCTADSCGTGDVCVHVPISEGAACVNGQSPGACVLGACLPACASIDCNDGEPCTLDTCDPWNGSCQHAAVPDLTACDFAGNPGLCTSGSCVGSCTVLDCDDSDPCTVDACDPGTGTCNNTPAAPGTPCDFGGLPGLCVAGSCVDAMLCTGVDCDDGNPCTADSCDPSDGLCDHVPASSGTACDFSGLPGTCLADTCVSSCDLLDCADADDCTDDLCDPFAGVCTNQTSVDGATCDAGLGECQAGTCQPTAPVWTTKTTTLELECTATEPVRQLGLLPFELTVATTPIVGGEAPRAFTAELSGVVQYPEALLDDLQFVRPGGSTTATIGLLNTVASLRSGAPTDEIALALDTSQLEVSQERYCNLPVNQPCVVDTDCLGGDCQGPVDAFTIPTSADCSPGGTCDTLGKVGAGSQCEANGFCVTGPLPLPVGVETRTYVPDSEGAVVFGWKDDMAVFAYLIGGLGAGPAVVGCVPRDLPDSAEAFFPIDTSAPVSCNGLDCNDGSDCTADSCALPSATCANTPLPEGSVCDFGGLPGSCVAGTCVAVCDTTICDDGNPCTAETCDPASGLCDVVVLDGSSCDAGGDAGVCVGSSCLSVCEAVGCDDSNACTSDVCEPSTGACTYEAAPEGTPCDAGGAPGFCTSGICVESALCQGVDCNDGNPCTNDSCDPQDGLCDNDPVQGSVGCDFGGLSGICLDGVCESECALIDCDDGDDCTADICDPVTLACTNDTAPDGTFCDSGYGRCQTGVCDPIPAGEWTTQTQVVAAACTNNLTSEQKVYPFLLTVRATAINGGAIPEPFAAELSGTFVLPEFFVDAAVNVGGATSGDLVALVSTAQVRSGATGPDVPLAPDVGAITPGEIRLCNLPPTQVCTADAECIGGVCEAPVLRINLPTSTDCAAGGVCDTLGKDSQCTLHGFCVTGDLLIPLGPEVAIYTPESSGDVLFGWVDQDVPGLSTCPAAAPDCQEAFMPDGCFDLPSATSIDPPDPMGVRFSSGGLFIPLQCAGATAGGICDSGEGCIVDADCATPPCTATPNVVCPTQDAGLIAFPIQ